jgi:DNA-binding NarL/FixJ family response regulator
MSRRRSIRILVASSQFAERFGLAVMMNSQDDMEVVAQTGCFDEAVNLLRNHKPDVALIGADLMDGETGPHVGFLRQQHPECRLVVLAAYGDDEGAASALQAGAAACLLTGFASGELLSAIRTVYFAGGLAAGAV